MPGIALPARFLIQFRNRTNAMSRKLFDAGSRGDIVRRIQLALGSAGCPVPKVDEIYGRDTRAAVAAFQQQRALPVTGAVELETWSTLTNAPVPELGERVLQLTAAFEGHNYTLAVGNFDGAWLTWGIIGFTMQHGEVQTILANIDAASPALLDRAFGGRAAEIRATMRAGKAQQKAWAIANSAPDGSLREPWKAGFAALGDFAEVRAEQRRRALADYYEPALRTAARFHLTSELGIALAFDIHVQNGGVDAEETAQVERELASEPGATELRRREIIANAVADHARAEYREDVRARKLTIARGAGAVHERNYSLENWGLAEIEPLAANA